MDEKNNAVEIIKNKKEYREKRIVEIYGNLLPYLRILWENKYGIIIINFIIGLLVVIYLLFLITPIYTSTILIIPDYGGKSAMYGQLSNFASLAGIKMGETKSSAIYNNLLKSESIIEYVITQKYATQKFKDSVNLIQYYEIEPEESEFSEEQQRLIFLTLYNKFNENIIQTQVQPETDILTLSVSMPESKLSAAVANNLIKALDYYVRNKRKSFASEQRFYLEKRTKEVRDSLTAAEERLKNFRDQNRIVKSPQLLLEQGRLTRALDILQTTYIELMKELELIKLDEVKDTPIINIREKAKEPVIKTGPRRLLILITIMFFTFLFTCSYYFLKPVYIRYKNILKTS